MTRTLIRLLLTLNTLIPYTLAGQALAGSCQPKEPAQQFEDPYACANRRSRKERWACAAAGISFPTGECLTQDIITLGNVRGKSCVSYSMGAKGIDASNYAQQGLNGRGVTFHMALDRDYIFRVLSNPKFRITDPTRNADNLNRQDIHVRKLSQAFASVCEGDAFLMILKRNGQGGGVGVYQTPWVKDSVPSIDRKDNVWENDEFPSLQLNGKVPRVYSINMSNGNAPHVDWTRGQDQQTRQSRNVEAIPLPS